MTLPDVIARDVETVQRISAVPALLRVICDNTGMGFAAVARVDDTSWTACAVLDRINFGLQPGGQLDVQTTLCIESRAARQPVVFDHASEHPVYCKHHTPRLYNIESYISVPIIRSDGSYFGNLCAIDPNPHEISEQKTIALFRGFADMIAHMLELEDKNLAAEVARIDAEEAIELRDQFIAVLGHDLRNPLATLSLIGELMARRTSEPEAAKTAQLIRSTTKRMGHLIGDVMDFAQARIGGKLDLAFKEIADLEVALSDVISEVASANPTRRIEGNIRVPGPVRGNRGRLQQVLSNLLGNALTHGADDQPIEVAAWLEGPWLNLSVRNWGEPIAPANLTRIFQPYWRPAQNRGHGGLGLGLHICSMIVKSHGGTIQVSSSREDGTRFIVRIPTSPGSAVVA
ncbi:GAF domain-containing sensor histidine kinase [Variovorax sp. KK3]|uniref:GAF domain-containing sensor histidine kinase n=1 Tax=Variovorax sp. KK3 TaxID=1855728 RepID=UPI00097C7E19|nr:GAF domain-containing sensor histidine kinase [Variovorax sp. KK3]